MYGLLVSFKASPIDDERLNENINELLQTFLQRELNSGSQDDEKVGEPLETGRFGSFYLNFIFYNF